VTLHQKREDTAPSEHDGSGEAGEAPTHDQNGNAKIWHDEALRSEYTDMYIRSRIFEQMLSA
jgi:hypothetical protein